MDFTLENFDFKTNLLTSGTEIDELLDECGLQIKSYEVKLGNRDLQLDKAQNRTENLGEDIAEVQALIASKETELTSFAEGTRKREEVSIEPGYPSRPSAPTQFPQNRFGQSRLGS